MQATPVVVDGVMFIASGGGASPRSMPRPAPSSGSMKRGLAGALPRWSRWRKAKCFLGGGITALMALDQNTGAVSLDDADCRPARGFTSAPAVYHDGLVYIGVAGGEEGVRGQFGAYDAKTGKEVWKFWTLPGPGELGHDTWEGDPGGTAAVPVWTHPAIDPELRMVYVPIGNAGPDNDGTDAWRRQPVHRLDRCARSEDGRLQVAFPGSAPRFLGLRQCRVACAGRHPLPGLGCGKS